MQVRLVVVLDEIETFVLNAISKDRGGSCSDLTWPSVGTLRVPAISLKLGVHVEYYLRNVEEVAVQLN